MRSLLFIVFSLLVSGSLTLAQDTVTGAFEGTVTNSQTGDPIVGATAEITNVETNITLTRRSDARGRFYQGLLAPGVYRIRVTQPGYQPQEVLQRLNIARTGEVVPVPVSLEPVATVSSTIVPVVTPPTPGAPLPAPAPASEIRSQLNTSDASRSGSFNETQLGLLPLGSVTLTRSFDELALLLPGVAPPPQTLGGVAGPGQGPGVGTAGQFAVNGLRSRGNNFTVDGSDNNDEDIGVRRQGFTALIPQPIESVREYQAITLLAPAQFGRNFGGIVNAVSKSGGNQVHGNLYGFFNSSQLNARNRFDGNPAASTPVTSVSGLPVILDGQPLSVTNNAGGEDSFTLGKVGATLGGPLRRATTFYFLAFEGQKINASQEEHFAVPTIEQRGAFGSGATGLREDPFNSMVKLRGLPASNTGNAFFSLFPFANDPQGVYGANTFTKSLPASGRGNIASGKLDHHFALAGKEQTLTGRYNFTDDWRELPKTGEALFSTLRPEVRTQNLSFFFNSQLSAPNAARAWFNQIRLSYGRTRLRFLEVRDRELLVASDNFPNEPFLLNRPRLTNTTRPSVEGATNTSAVIYQRLTSGGQPRNTESALGPLGQVVIAGFSPLGVDVYNFPQRRVNNTYQFADNLTARMGQHQLTMGTDNRRSELNSNQPRLFRPLVTFQGAPLLTEQCAGSNCQLVPSTNGVNRYFRPEDLASTGAASNAYFTLANAGNNANLNFASDCQNSNLANCRDASLNLLFYQLNFFAQDHWRGRPNLTLAYGLRYEYNTPPREQSGRLEQTFNDPALEQIRCASTTPTTRCGFRPLLAGRSEIFTTDRDNFAPRLSLAYAPRWFGNQRPAVLRVGGGMYFDQLLGAVVSQSRNLYPTFLTLNFGGLNAQSSEVPLGFNNPGTVDIGAPLIRPGSFNQLGVPLPSLLDFLSGNFPNALGATLPTARLATPAAWHYSVAFEQQLGNRLSLSAAYVGTQGRHLLRFNTPNLGAATNAIPLTLSVSDTGTPTFRGRICSPSPSASGICKPGRVFDGIGAINQFETSANSRYDALQLELRGRFTQGLQLNASYVLASAQDDVSDVFELAGAYALPQNSFNLAAERGPANFDVRHRATFSLVYDLGEWKDRAARLGWLLKGLQLASLGQLQTGQPFTVNSVFDVNLDGNLTDRLNTSEGLLPTHEGRQPLLLRTANPTALLAIPGQDGRVARNAFRAAGLVQVDVALSKAIPFAASRRLLVRAELFNLLNQANYGVPVRLLEAPSFGQAVQTVTPGLRAQFGLKLEF